MTVPALHEVHEVQHDDESHGDVHVPVVAGAVAGGINLGTPATTRKGEERGGGGSGGVISADVTSDDRHPTPDDGGEAAGDEESEDEAFPVRVAPQGAAERLLDWSLLCNR